MLEKLPDALGHALRGQRAGLDKIAFQAVDLRAGMASITVTSLAFVDHGPMPARYTADGAGVSPPLQWRGAPSNAGSLALLVEDADAPTPQPLVHAIVVDLAVGDGSGALAEDALSGKDGDTAQLHLGRNSYLQTGWRRPTRRLATACTATRSRCSRSRPAPRSTARRVATPYSRRSASAASASGCLIGRYERPDTSIKTPADAETAPIATARLAT